MPTEPGPTEPGSSRAAGSTQPTGSTRPARWTAARPQRGLVAIAVVALLARVVPVWRGGGLHALSDYDDGVYYAASTSLVHGQLPYRDYLLLHPPGSTLLLAPFALLARVTSDSVGFETARVGFMLLGAVNAVLVVVVAGRLGRRAGVLAGLFYALFFPAVYVARTISLEELGTTSLLVALALIVRAGGSARSSGAQLVAGGAALGIGATVKIWGVVPLLVILGWQWFAGGPSTHRPAGNDLPADAPEVNGTGLSRRGAAGRLLAGAVGAVVIVCLPFYVAAPGAMFRYVVSDQLGRGASGGTVWSRLRDIAGVRPLLAGWPVWAAYTVLVLAVATGLAATAAALRHRDTAVFGALVLVLGVVLLESPSFFDHYAAFTAAPIALVVGPAADRLVPMLTIRVRLRWLTAVALVLLIAVAAPGVFRPQGVRVPSALTAAAAKVPGCITADDPTVLILMNAQSRDLRRHCPVWADVTGITYDTGDGRTADNGGAEREADTRWQSEIRAYLLSGSATIVTREETHLDPANTAVITALPPLFTSGQFVLRATR